METLEQLTGRPTAEMIAILRKSGRAPRGRVQLFASPDGFKRGKLLFERDNLIVNSGLTAFANLLGNTAGYIAAAVGYGSSATTPAVTDVDLTAAPKYYNAITGHSFPNSASVLFNYSLVAADYGAINITIQELGLYSNSTTVGLPVLSGGAQGAWQASHAYTVGNLIIDSNTNLQRCTTAGTSGGTAPTWSTVMSGTTTDNTATWTLVALHTIPTPLIAHVVVPSFVYGGAGNYSGTWTITF